jgi:leader peptidase (prepilin peptidase)/N-methyltransferase
VATAAASTLVAVGCFYRFGFGTEAVVASCFAVVLVVLAAIDLERRIIPNRIVLPATGLILATQIALSPDRAFEWVAAAVGTALFLLLPLLIYPSGMGMGDVKLALLLGAGLGWAVVPALFVGLMAAFVAAVVVLARGGLAARKTALPFGPFLAFGGLVALFFS